MEAQRKKQNCLVEATQWLQRFALKMSSYCIRFELLMLFPYRRNSLRFKKGLRIDMFCFSAFSVSLVGVLALVFSSKVTFKLQVCAEVVPEEAISTGVWT